MAGTRDLVGVWRWVTLAGAGMVVLGFQATAVGEWVRLEPGPPTGSGRCVVRYEDPDVREVVRTGEFRCGAEEALVVTAWPWRGRLSEVSDRRPVAPAWVTTGLGVGGTLLAATGFGCGMHRRTG
ncbi:hypothetical protein ACN20G_17200 [Streptomyces sp. BI20]|uniref:hypothetical protein n=1 Tax=Streptomyces sp. BI20 TaxID=3403460 RepID=UPI003C711C53